MRNGKTALKLAAVIVSCMIAVFAIAGCSNFSMRFAGGDFDGGEYKAENATFTVTLDEPADEGFTWTCTVPDEKAIATTSDKASGGKHVFEFKGEGACAGQIVFTNSKGETVVFDVKTDSSGTFSTTSYNESKSTYKQ